MRQTDADSEREIQRAERIQRAQLQDLTALLKRREFRRYLKRYLTLASVFKTTFTGNSETFFREGQRSIGTTMLGEMMQADPKAFALVMAEKMPEDDSED